LGSQIGKLSLGLAKAPGNLTIAVLALTFGASGDTDSFFLVYSVVLFIAAIISYASELLAPGLKTLLLGVAIAAICLLSLAVVTGSTLGFLFVPYLICASISSTLLGQLTRQGRIKPLIVSNAPHFVGAAVILLHVDTLQQVILVLSAVEVGKLVSILMFTRNFNAGAHMNWSYAFGMLLATAVGASSGVIDKSFAFTLADSSTTILTYGAGGLLLLATTASYGVTVARLRDELAQFPFELLLLLTVGCAFMGLGVALLTEGWVARSALVWTIMSPNVLLVAQSAWLRASLVLQHNWKLTLQTAILFAVVNIIGDWAFLRWGVYGIASATLIANTIYVSVLWMKEARTK